MPVCEPFPTDGGPANPNNNTGYFKNSWSVFLENEYFQMQRHKAEMLGPLGDWAMRKVRSRSAKEENTDGYRIIIKIGYPWPAVATAHSRYLIERDWQWLDSLMEELKNSLPQKVNNSRETVNGILAVLKQHWDDRLSSESDEDTSGYAPPKKSSNREAKTKAWQFEDLESSPKPGSFASEFDPAAGIGFSRSLEDAPIVVSPESSPPEHSASSAPPRTNPPTSLFRPPVTSFSTPIFIPAKTSSLFGSSTASSSPSSTISTPTMSAQAIPPNATARSTVSPQKPSDLVKPISIPTPPKSLPPVSSSTSPTRMPVLSGVAVSSARVPWSSPGNTPPSNPSSPLSISPPSSSMFSGQSPSYASSSTSSSPTSSSSLSRVQSTNSFTSSSSPSNTLPPSHSQAPAATSSTSFSDLEFESLFAQSSSQAELPRSDSFQFPLDSLDDFASIGSGASFASFTTFSASPTASSSGSLHHFQPPTIQPRRPSAPTVVSSSTSSTSSSTLTTTQSPSRNRNHDDDHGASRRVIHFL